MPKITEFETDPGLLALQEAVGGWIEVVPNFTFFNGRACQAVCDEEGKLKYKEVNREATAAWRACSNTNDFLVGDIAIIYGGLK